MRQSHISRTAIIATSIIALSGCWKQFWSPDLVSAPEVSHEFPGVHQLVKNEDVDVLLVHGMCTHDMTWVKKSVESLSEQLGHDPKKLEYNAVQVEGSRALVYKSKIPSGQHNVNISAIVWSPILAPLKGQLCYDQKHKSDMCTHEVINAEEFKPRRAFANRIGKDVILDDCLADAIIYQGQARTQINEQMKDAVLTAATPEIKARSKAQLRTDAKNRHHPLVVVAESLGSKASLDALALLGLAPCDSEDYEAAKSTYQRISKVFMAANQIPMLQLADQRLDSPGPRHQEIPSCQEQKALMKKGGGVETSALETLSDPLAALARRFKDDVPEKSKLTMITTETGVQQQKRSAFLVAFSDPNDALTYELTNSTLSKVEYGVLDVRISNSFSWLGLFENPYSAHTTYLETRGVANLIVCGHNQQKPCP